MTEIGTVTAVKGKVLTIEIPRSKACSGCKACIPLDGKDTMSCFVLNECGAKVGDRVELAPGESKELGASLLLFGVPLVCFLVFLLIGKLLTTELISFLIALGVMGVSYLAVFFISKKIRAERFMKRAVNIAGPLSDRQD